MNQICSPGRRQGATLPTSLPPDDPGIGVSNARMGACPKLSEDSIASLYQGPRYTDHPRPADARAPRMGVHWA